LRRAFIVKKHHELKYPEGTACADVLIVGEKGGASAVTVFVGFGIAFVYQFLWQGLKLWKEVASYPLRFFKNAGAAVEVNPALLGVGYIIGTKISCVMVAGGVLASFVLIPAIRLFGEGLEDPVYPGTKLIGKMDEETIWKSYVLYIGAGAVAAGGIISLFQALPLIVGSVRAGFRDLTASRDNAAGSASPRTDRDLPIWIVGVGALGLVLLIWITSLLHRSIPAIPNLNMNLFGAVLIVLFGFLFVTVSSRLTGEIGSSSNPISGMTVATLLLTCLIFLVIGWTRDEDRLTALSVAAVVCIAASNGGTTSQDLKTGYLVGATPGWQQIAILVGSLSSALVIGYILVVLNGASTVFTAKNLPVLAEPLAVDALTETARAPDGNTYHVWQAKEGNDQDVPQGKYLVNDQGFLKYLEDPGINGSASRRDDGTEVQKFKAPKARLMALITDGILTQKLAWTLVLLGVAIAVTLELCGIPSLPFAVGVYLPLSSSTPIFFGGLARWVAERWSKKPSGQSAAAAELEAESSPGVLMATGYIAGGSIAGVLIAFLSFSDTIPNLLSFAQYRTVATAKDGSLDDTTEELGKKELGLPEGKVRGRSAEDLKDFSDEASDLNQDLQVQFFRVPAGTTLQLPKDKTFEVAKERYLGAIAKETDESAAVLFDLNVGQFVKVPENTSLNLPKFKTYTVEKDATLGELAKQLLGRPMRARQLWELNRALLVRVPAGTVLRLSAEDETKKTEVSEETPLAAVAAKTLGGPEKAKTLLTLNPVSLTRPLREAAASPTEIDVAKGTILRLPIRETAEVKTGGSLAQVARELLGSAEKAPILWELNMDSLQPPVAIPAGTAFKVPQATWPSLLAFAFLTLFLVAVGLGWIFRPAETLNSRI
jgi:uncharacterized oligopeptide transporter (OPT) family protein/nucleoid-associated protein YgaU